jgi:hypothetical protein
MFHTASKEAFKPEPQPSSSGTHVSAVLNSPDNPDHVYSEEALLLMLTHSTFTLKAEQNIFCDFLKIFW